MSKITIRRAFERTRQIADFVPIKAYCELSEEVDIEDSADLANISASLAEACEKDVEMTLMKYRPVCIVCGGKGETLNLTKEGVCGNCMNDRAMKIAELKREKTK
ncbi:MAG: hypothetical protein KGJ90_04950 [Patescibacteria group bacterium]|nr:hypothetical protein [Patescibacteria group bacterium]